MKLFLAILIAAVFAATAFGADVAGTWKGTFESPRGATDATLVLKAGDGKLTGTLNLGGEFGEAPLLEGKVDGDNVSFAVVRDFNGQEIRFNYKGTVNGNEIKLTMEVVGMDMTLDMTLKRAS